MPGRGPAPKPTNLRLLEGGKPRRSEPQPQATKGAKPPTRLSAGAKRVWRAHAPELERLGLLTCVDLSVFEAFCTAYARHLEAEDALTEAGGLTYTTDTGYVRPRPEIGISIEYAKLAKAIADGFGFTPSSRTRIEVPKQAKRSLFSDYD